MKKEKKPKKSENLYQVVKWPWEVDLINMEDTVAKIVKKIKKFNIFINFIIYKYYFLYKNTVDQVHNTEDTDQIPVKEPATPDTIEEMMIPNLVLEKDMTITNSKVL